MSDQGTDTFVGVVLALVVVAGVVAAAGGVSAGGSPNSPGNSTTLGSRSPQVGATEATAASNIPGGTLSGCSGTVIANRNRRSAAIGDLNLKVYYNPSNGGQNCAIATRTGRWSGPRGRLVITLRFADYNGESWPGLATHRSKNYATRTDGVYLNNADDRCVSARVRFKPASGKSVSLDTGRIGCD